MEGADDGERGLAGWWSEALLADGEDGDAGLAAAAAFQETLATWSGDVMVCSGAAEGG